MRSTAFAAALLLAGCFGDGAIAVQGMDVTPVDVDDGVPVPPDFAPPGSTTGTPGATSPGTTPSDDRLVGAGGRDLTEFWDPIPVAYSNNVKMLSFDMMVTEVKRALDLSWKVGGVDQWEANRSTLGGANYQTTFSEDITPSQQKVLLWRKMAYQVCADAVARDAGKTTRVVFTDVDPGVAVSTSNAAVNAQVDSLYQRFFLEDAPAAEHTRATTLLAAAYADGTDAKEAWRALCVGYLASLKFLSY